jgi:GNAT superfamily N-acetyltransferase
MRAQEFVNPQLREDIEDFPIANVRRPNGAIGNQGVNIEQAADVLTHAAGMQVSPDMSMRQLVDALRADPAAQQRLRQFVQQNPVTVYALPDGSYHLQDGHHRTFLLNLLGDETVPAVVKEDATQAKTVEFEGLTLKVIKQGHELIVDALDDWGNKVLGHVKFNIGDGKELDPQDLHVDDKYQGQGIARVMYDYVKSLGYTINRSWDQTDAGAGFWNKHRGEDVRVWENLDEKINQDIATQSWRAEKTITVPDIGELHLRARNTSHITPPQFIVDVATPDGKNIGYFRFLVMDWEAPKTGWFATKSKKDPYVIGGNVSVWDQYQKKGIARQVYQWIKSLGNDVRPSTTQTAAGKAMWRGFERDPIEENFADGKNPGRKGLSKRVGVNTKASVSSLRKTAKNSSGEKQRMAHWLANMKSGRAKAKRK